MHCSWRLTVQTLVFSHSYLHRQVSPPETLVVKGGRGMADEFCLKMPNFHVTFRDLLHAVNLRQGQKALLPFRRKACWGFFRPEKSDGFGLVWTRELGYKRPARYLDHRSRFRIYVSHIIWKWRTAKDELCRLRKGVLVSHVEGRIKGR